MNILNLRKKNYIPNFVINKILEKLLKRFLTTPNETEKYMQSNYSVSCIHHYKFDSELQLINTKPMKKKKLLSVSKKAQKILVQEYKKRK